MTTESIQISSVISASPNRVYTVWLDERKHSAVTGGLAKIDSWVGGRHSWGDGDVEGHFVRLETGRRIVMTWRSSAFPRTTKSSVVEVRFEPVAGGTKVVISHELIPYGQSEHYRRGGRRHYLGPLKRCFSRPFGLREAMRGAMRASTRSRATKLSDFASAPPPKKAPKSLAVEVEPPKKAAPKKASKKK